MPDAIHGIPRPLFRKVSRPAGGNSYPPQNRSRDIPIERLPLGVLSVPCLARLCGTSMPAENTCRTTVPATNRRSDSASSPPLSSAGTGHPTFTTSSSRAAASRPRDRHACPQRGPSMAYKHTRTQRRQCRPPRRSISHVPRRFLAATRAAARTLAPKPRPRPTAPP